MFISHCSVRSLVLSILMLLLVGCGASGARFSRQPISNDKATVYIYRVGSIVGAAGHPYLSWNDQKIVRIDNGGYFVHEVSPGLIEYDISLVETIPLYSFRAEAGKEYFLQYKLGYPNTLEAIEPTKALRKLKNMRMFANYR